MLASYVYLQPGGSDTTPSNKRKRTRCRQILQNTKFFNIKTEIKRKNQK